MADLKPRLYKILDVWVCTDAEGNEGCGHNPIQAYEDYDHLKAMKDAYQSVASMIAYKPSLIDRVTKWMRG